MTDGAFPRDKHLTAIAIAYRNPDLSYIADAILPRVPVGKMTFEYWEYPLGQAFEVPDLRVGERSAVPRVQLGGSRETATCEDFGVEIPLTRGDIDQAPKGVDPRERATEMATDLVYRHREVDVAALVFNAAAYPAANKVDVSGTATDMWDDYDNSNPIPYIVERLDSCPMRPNALAFGQAAWNKLSMHPKVVKAANGNDGGEGRASRQRVAELLEVSEIVVGASLLNTVKAGKTPVLSKVWGKHMLAFYRDRTVGTSGGLTFGICAQYGDKVAGSKDVDMGLRGGVVVRSGESRKDLIIAPSAAFFFQNVIA